MSTCLFPGEWLHVGDSLPDLWDNQPSIGGQVLLGPYANTLTFSAGLDSTYGFLPCYVIVLEPARHTVCVTQSCIVDQRFLLIEMKNFYQEFSVPNCVR